MDNRYYKYGCPPLMNDGRFISNYVRSSTFDQYIKNLNNINSSHKFRHYIQNNGYEIINNIKGYYRENNTCSVEGKCLPLSGSEIIKIKNEDKKNIWYEELLDETPTQLDFMMTNNNEYNNININNNFYKKNKKNDYNNTENNTDFLNEDNNNTNNLSDFLNDNYINSQQKYNYNINTQHNSQHNSQHHNNYINIQHNSKNLNNHHN